MPPTEKSRPSQAVRGATHIIKTNERWMLFTTSSWIIEIGFSQLE